MDKRMIQFSPPDISEEEIGEVVKTLRSGWITTGPRTKELERELAKYLGVNRLACLNSATAAEETILRVLGIKEGDEVIVPAYTYTATAAAAIHVGARVVFVDSKRNGDKLTHAPEMDYEQMEEAITDRTKAIIPVDIGGIPCDYDVIFDVIERKKKLFKPGTEMQKQLGRIAVVADCAHGLGARRNGLMTGSIADFTFFSFHAVKNFTTAEGGAITCNPDMNFDEEKIYKHIQLLSLHGQDKDALEKAQIGSWEYDIVGPWYKNNMTDIVAAIGLKQLKRYPDMLKRRHEIIKAYDAICDERGVFHVNHIGENYYSSGHLYLTRLTGVDEKKRNEVIIEMGKRGISTNVHYKPLPMMTAYKSMGWNIQNFPNAFDYYQNLITLPLHTLLTDEDVAYITKNWCEVVESLT